MSRNIVKILGVEVALGEILQRQVSFQDSMNKMTLGELNSLLGTTVRKSPNKKIVTKTVLF